MNAILTERAETNVLAPDGYRFGTMIGNGWDNQLIRLYRQAAQDRGEYDTKVTLLEHGRVMQPFVLLGILTEGNEDVPERLVAVATFVPVETKIERFALVLDVMVDHDYRGLLPGWTMTLVEALLRHIIEYAAVEERKYLKLACDSSSIRQSQQYQQIDFRLSSRAVMPQEKNWYRYDLKPI